MKDRILFLIIGVLLGAIITTGCFMILGKNIWNKVSEMQRMEQRGERPEMGEMQKPTDENGNELKDPHSDSNEK